MEETSKKITMRVAARFLARILSMVIAYILTTKYGKNISDFPFLSEDIMEEVIIYGLTVLSALSPEIYSATINLLGKFKTKEKK